MLLENNDEEWCEPVSHAKQKRVENCSEMISTSYSCNDVDNYTCESPNESGDLNSPDSDDLSRQSKLYVSLAIGG
jgi:hypothetical protein